MKRLLLFAGISLALVGCSSNESSIIIGYIGPLTGDAVSYGKDTLNATKLAVDEWNAKGGIIGKKIVLIAEDGGCNGAEAAKAAHKLIDIDRVVAILGGNCSNETLAAAPVAEAAKTILLAPITSSKDATTAGDFVFRIWPSNAKAAPKVYASFLQEKGFRKIAMLSEQTIYCKSLKNTVSKAIPDGSVIVFNEDIEAGSKDFRSLLTRLKDVDFDLLFINLQGDSSIGAFMKQYRDLGLTQQVLGNDIAESASLKNIAGDEMEGVYVLSLISPQSASERGKAFVESFTKHFGAAKQAPSFPAAAYDGANILFTTIAQVGTDGPALRDALYQLRDFQGVIGQISFDQNGDAYGVPYGVKQWKNGEIVQLKVVPLE